MLGRCHQRAATNEVPVRDWPSLAASQKFTAIRRPGQSDKKVT
jgi:hypothetical protein